MKFIFSSIIALALVCFSFDASAQSTDQKSKSSKYETVELKVKGVCGMCKSRIELATYDLKGVKSAKWDLESDVLTAVIQPSKVTREEIGKALAARGHDNEIAKAEMTAYKDLPGCCKYNDGIKKHGGGK